MKKLFILLIGLCVITSCSNSSKQDEKPSENDGTQVYTNDLFTFNYPDSWEVRDITPAGAEKKNIHRILIKRNSSDTDYTSITWETSNVFPMPAKDFAHVMESKMMDEYKGAFYEIVGMDSTYLVSGKFPSYSISSIFTDEKSDTIFRTRTCIVSPNKFDMMIVQQIHARTSEELVNEQSEIIGSLKFIKE